MDTMIPPLTATGLNRWIQYGITPGHFLSAVLRNDLREAVAHADDKNRAALPEIVEWLRNNAPMGCWGGPAVMQQWQLSKKHEMHERQQGIKR